MRFLHAADLHGGLTRYGIETPTGNSRIDDFEMSLGALIEYADRHKPDAVLIAGDTGHSRQLSPAVLRILARGLRDLTALAPVHIIPGNHDGMSTIGDLSSHSLAWLNAVGMPNLTVHLKPSKSIVVGRTGPFGLVTLPYPHKRAFDEQLAHLAPDDRVAEIGRRLESVIEQRLASLIELDASVPRIFLGHLSVFGARLGGEAAMRISWDVTIGSHVFNDFDYAALGHIHRPQRIGQRAWYAGSAQYTDFSEADHAKVFLLADVARGAEPVVTELSSGARPMFIVDFVENAQGRWTSESQADLADSIVKVRVFPRERGTATPQRVAKLISMAREAGASFIKVEVIEPEAQDKPRITLDADLAPAEALARWLEARGLPLEPTLTAGRDLIESAV